jgi:hypothetical protein
MNTSTVPEEIQALRDLGRGQRADEYIEFWTAGTLVTGLFSCVACGRTVVSTYQLEPCPSCGGTLWEDPSTSPFEATAIATPQSDYEEWTTEGLERAASLCRMSLAALVGGPLLWLFLATSAYVLLK